MLEQRYKRFENVIVILMLIGIIAMLQPWFKNVVELFEGLAPEAKLGRTYTREVAPVIFRYGFYVTLLSTVAFIVISHYSVTDLRKSFSEKGIALTWIQIALPIAFGISALVNLADFYNLAVILAILGIVGAIALWNWRRWGLAAIAIAALSSLGLAVNGQASLLMASGLVTLLVATMVLIWPRRSQLTGGPRQRRIRRS